MKKRRHHYVWRKYLRAWSNNDSIYCLRDGKIFKTNLMGVAQKRDFYKLKEMSKLDIEFIVENIIANSNKELRETHINFMNFFQHIFILREELGTLKDKKLDEIIDEEIHNLEEDLHAHIEEKSIPYIESILEENVNFFNSLEDRANFSYFLFVQFVRTQKRKHDLTEAFKNEKFNIDSIWSVMSHIFAMNMANSLASDENNKMVLLVNKNEDEFITGDQPVFNTYADNNKLVEQHEFYYPISPNLAVLLTDKKEKYNSQRHIVGVHEVAKYNQLIVKNSHEQIYSTSEKALEIVKHKKI